MTPITVKVAALPGVTRAFTQGSRARGTAIPSSDHDVVAVCHGAIDRRMRPHEALEVVREIVQPCLGHTRLQRCSVGARGIQKVDLVPAVQGSKVLWIPNVESGMWHPTDPEFEARWFMSRAQQVEAVAASRAVRGLLSREHVKVGGYPVDYLCGVLAPRRGHPRPGQHVIREIGQLTMADLERALHPQRALQEPVFQRVSHLARRSLLRLCRASVL